VPYLVPAKELTDEKGENGPKTLDQDRDGYVEASNRLMTDILEYGRISDLSREVTNIWLNKLRADAQEQWLLRMRPKRQVHQVRQVWDPTTVPSTKFLLQRRWLKGQCRQVGACVHCIKLIS